MWRKADVIIMFGATPLSGVRVFADALGADVAATSMIVGGEGHTIPALREHAKRHRPDIDWADATESSILQRYLRASYGATADLLGRVD